MDDITSLGTGINYNGGLGVIHSLRDPSPCQKVSFCFPIISHCNFQKSKFKSINLIDILK
jgi:hypothetical protein